MEPKNITQWRVPTTKLIEVTQIGEGTKYTLEVREFIPLNGDMLEERWRKGDEDIRFRIPPYAIADIHKASVEFEKYINRHVGHYVKNFVRGSDALIAKTYLIAWSYMARKAVSYLPSSFNHSLIHIASLYPHYHPLNHYPLNLSLDELYLNHRR